MPLPGLSSSRSFPGITDECKETWKNVVEEVISCVLDNSPSDEILAMYLGSDIANKYRVCHIQFWKNEQLDKHADTLWNEKIEIFQICFQAHITSPIGMVQEKPIKVILLVIILWLGEWS